MNTERSIMECVDYSTEKLGYPMLSYEQKLKFIGPPLMYSYTHAYGCSEEEARELIAAYREFYGVDALLHVDPYDGIYDLCQGVIDLGLKAAVATNKAQIYADRILQHFGFDKYTNLIFGADKEDKLKKSDIIKLAIKAAGITDFSEVVMIGDSDNDAIGARDAGVDFIGVTYGFGFGSKNNIEDFPHIRVFDSAYQLIDFFK
jgi:phosphoglycolate phosphatase